MCEVNAGRLTLRQEKLGNKAKEHEEYYSEGHRLNEKRING